MNAPIDRYHYNEEQPEISTLGYVVIFGYAIFAIVVVFLALHAAKVV